MNDSLYLPAAIGFGTLTAVCAGLLVWAIQKVAKENPQVARKTSVLTLGALLFWFGVLATLSLTGFYSDFSVLPPRLLIFGALPPILVVLWLTITGRTDKLLSSIPPTWPIYLQTFRLPVEILLWMLFIQNLLPMHMTFEGRNWDILVGITAVPLGYLLLGRGRQRFPLAVLWNILGLCLLANIVIIAVLSMPTPLRVFNDDPSAVIMATFPFSFLPGFLVPLAFSLHVLSLRQLFVLKRAARENTQGIGIEPAAAR